MSMRRRRPHLPVFCLLFLLFLCPDIMGQLLPPIRSFDPSAYGADNQNWALDQDSNGWMYFANNGGLLEYNGVSWYRYPSPNGSALRSVRAVGGRVYSGCYMEFGFWERDSMGLQVYTSLSESLGESLLPDEEFWQIQALDQWVLFQSLKRIYAYRADTGQVTVIPSEASRSQLYLFEDSIYYRKEDQGLMQMQNGQARVVLPRSVIGNRIVVGMLRLGEQPALVTEDGQFLILGAEGAQAWTAPGLQAFPSVKVYRATQLSDGSLALGTISEGFILLNKNGEFESRIGKPEGLNTNTVLSIYEDRNQNIWLGLDNGIGVINRGSAFSVYTDREGALGVVYAALEFEGRLYLGTNQGLYQAPIGTHGPYTLVTGTEGQVWSLREFGGNLLCGHHTGTFQVRGNQAVRISDAPGIWDIKPVPASDSLLLQGGYGGLSLLSRGALGWELRNTVEGFGISSRFFEFTPEGNLLVNHEFKGVYTLEADPDFRRITDSLQTPAFGFGASLFTFRGQRYYANSSGVFRYAGSQDGFVPDSLLNVQLYRGEDPPVGVLISDTQGEGLWGFGARTIYRVQPEALGNALRTRAIHVPDGFRRSLGVVGFECIVPLADGRYLIGRSDGYLLLDLDKLHEGKPEVFLYGVTHHFYNRDSTYRVSLEEEYPEFPYRRNNLGFSFGVPLYDQFREVEYQYFLEGFQDSWGAWTTQTEARFENLPHGSYAFRVRARVGDTLSEGEARYEFEVARPWYLTLWALALFVLGGLALAYFIHIRYRAHYRRQQVQLEEQSRKKLKRKQLKARKKLVEMRNANLRQEIESKNRELAVSTMSLIKKNEFLNALKDQLRRAENPGQVRAVIRTIDRSINNAEDWEFFETAFNNADQDFLHNVKQRHPDLTPNDLKLCAYLRLNLSSKEIAPLLNISVRSVEVKRYRLRKKMGLDHKQSLTSYILGL